MTDVGHKPGREKTARYIADNVPDPAPVKGATCSPVSYAAQRRSFNPRPREGATTVWRCSGRIAAVSIHAPVKGATNQASLDAMRRQQVSIHAPVKGATNL